MMKKGISAIVATVLIVLITVAGVAIIWIAIVPMIQDKVAFDSLDSRVSVVTAGGYTVYDADEEVAIVQVKRDVDDGVMDRIRIIFSIGGSSVSSTVVAPASGGTKTYTFDLSGYGVPESVSVAPIFVSDSGREKEGVVTSEVDVLVGEISDVPVPAYDLGRDYYFEMPVTGLVSWWRFDGDYTDSVGDNDGIRGGDINLVDNPGFETGDLTSWGIIDSGNLSAEVVSDVKRSGDYSVKLTKLNPTSISDAHYFAIYNSAIDNTNGTSYNMSAWVNGSLGDEVRIGIQRSGGTGGSGTPGWYMGSYETFALDGTWQFVNTSITFDTGVNSNANGYVRLALKSVSPTLFSAYFDDVVLTSDSNPSWEESDSVLKFDGINDYIDMSSNEWPFVFNEGEDFTVLAWVNPSMISRSSIVGQRYGDTMVLALENDGKFYLSMDDTRHDSPKSDNILSVGVWSHVAASYTSSDASNVSKLYFNGQPSGGGVTYDGNGISGQYDLYVGWQSRSDTQGSAGSFNGLIDEVIVYDRALTQDEIKAIYENQKGGKI